MYKVIMNGHLEVGTKFDSKTKAQDYGETARAGDRACGQKVADKVVKC